MHLAPVTDQFEEEYRIERLILKRQEVVVSPNGNIIQILPGYPNYRINVQDILDYIRVASRPLNKNKAIQRAREKQQYSSFSIARGSLKRFGKPDGKLFITNTIDKSLWPQERTPGTNIPRFHEDIQTLYTVDFDPSTWKYVDQNGNEIES